ncbi:MAG: thiamine-phosphate kinase [Bdellovibrionales bacterium]
MNEFELVQTYFKPLTMDRAEAGGLVDDAAILNIPEGFDLVVSSDTLNAGVHFMKSFTPAQIAHKCLRVNLSDMAAMGAEPYCYQLNLAFSDKPDAAWARDFAGALMADQREFGVFCSGGDTTVTDGPLLVSMTMTGLVPTGRAVKRGGAKPGDMLVVSGAIGQAVIGLKIMLGVLEVDAPEDFIAASCKPSPRTPISGVVAKYAHAAIDISDGFLSDVGHICAASGVGACIEAEAIPFTPATQKLLNSGQVDLETLLSGGDDYELALAVPPDAVDVFIAAAAQCGVQTRVVGVFETGGGVRVLDANGQEMAFQNTGWTHF